GPPPGEDAWATVGGGIYSSGSLDASNVTVSGNSAADAAGIFITDSAGLTIVHSATIAHNSSSGSRELSLRVFTGGVANYAPSGAFRLQNSILAANTAPGDSKDC